MALVYAARYPGKIHGLVLAGAPVDINAGESELSRVAHSVPTSVFQQDLGSAAVGLSLLFAGAIWLLALAERLGLL